MSGGKKLFVRVSPAFKANTQTLIDELFELGYLDTNKLSSYVRDAVKEKRARDLTLINGKPPESVRTTANHSAS